MADDTPTPAPAATPEAMTTSLVERLHFFFSNANLRQDKWMRTEMKENGCITLDQLLKFQTIKSISTDKELLVKAAGELKEEITYDAEKEELRRVVPFDWETMGDGSHLSLCCKNVPLTEEDKSEGEKAFYGAKHEYAVTRDELKALFEPFGKVGIVKLRFGRKEGKAYPLGMAIIEFENEEGMAKASAELLPKEGEAKEIEIKGNKLTYETVKPMKCFQKGAKRTRDDKKDDNDKQEKEEEEEIKFEPVKVEMVKGCVIALTGLSDETCDRESIREAVSDILKVTKDIKTSGLYVDYTRGATSGNLRLTESKPEEMKELVAKLNDGTILIANSKVGSAKMLEGEEEVAYWKGFEEFLNNRKRADLEEKRQKKKQKRFSHKGRGGGRRRQ
ncbi:hypothetical protein QTG54_012322 [Skeletonema marinoi]|uniref:Lupus La protein n=1 Tax=Skeletonema marinoi TaxID=267567 RepID=A0AAD8Y013_9STRA|nr:hypothetical protein QTG54_012322 [Skeletonema marinoi]